MKYDNERSLVYDSIRYYDITLNYHLIKKSARNIGVKESSNFQMWYKIKSQDLKPFNENLTMFFRNESCSSVLILFFLYNINIISDFEEFKKILHGHAFYDYVIEYYTYYNKLKLVDVYSSPFKEDIKINLALFMAATEMIINELIEALSYSYKLCQRLYMRYDTILENFDVDKIINKIRPEYTNFINEDIIYCISYLHPYFYKYTKKSVEEAYWILGYECNYVADMELKYDKRYNHVTKKFALALSKKKLYCEIINVLSAGSFFSRPEIIKKMKEKYNVNFDKNRLDRILHELLVNNVIDCSYTYNDNESVYSLREEFFEYVETAFNLENFKAAINILGGI